MTCLTCCLQLGPDKDWSLVFAVFDENNSWYMKENICNKSDCNDTDPDVYNANVIYSKFTSASSMLVEQTMLSDQEKCHEAQMFLGRCPLYIVTLVPVNQTAYLLLQASTASCSASVSLSSVKPTSPSGTSPAWAPRKSSSRFTSQETSFSIKGFTNLSSHSSP